MNRLLRINVCIAVFVVGSLFPQALGTEIIGNVVDSNKIAIEGVTVSAYRDSMLVGRSTPSDKTGFFKLTVDDGAVDVLEFRKAGYHLGLITALHDKHGERKNSIIKLMYRNPKGTMRFPIRMNILLNYEILYYSLVHTSKSGSASESKREEAIAGLQKNYRMLIEKLRSGEKEWTKEQGAVYRAAYERVARLYGVEGQ